ncbi:hypothetical protein J6590_002303 [Homalodisca vitripennis]|nr:hypothetical protein J6590_002303 [Homalodisca vitripennis]
MILKVCSSCGCPTQLHVLSRAEVSLLLHLPFHVRRLNLDVLFLHHTVISELDCPASLRELTSRFHLAPYPETSLPGGEYSRLQHRPPPPTNITCLSISPRMCSIVEWRGNSCLYACASHGSLWLAPLKLMKSVGRIR